jgi:hypothetical protein
MVLKLAFKNSFKKKLFVFSIFIIFYSNSFAQQIVNPKSSKNLRNQFFISFVGGINSSNILLNTNYIQTPFLYKIDEISNNGKRYDISYFAGLRLDRQNEKKFNYFLTITLNKITPFVNYTDLKYNSYLYGYYSNILLDKKLYYTGFSSNIKYKIRNGKRHDYHLIAGTEMYILINNNSLNNNSENIYNNNIIPKYNIGFELSNKSFYNIFIHYSNPILKNGFTKSFITSDYSEFKIGLSLKARYF